MDKNDWMHMDHVGAENNHGAGAQDLWAIVQLHADNTWLLYFKIYILGYSTQCHMIYVICHIFMRTVSVYRQPEVYMGAFM